MKTTPQTPFSRPATDLRSKRLVRRSPSPLALEQRFMFDGAAVADAVDTVSKPTDTAMPESGAHLLNVATTDARGVSETLVAAQAEAEKLVGQFLNSPDAQAQLFALFNGAQGSEPSVAWQAAFDQLMNSFRNGETPVRVELRHGEELQNALGAFSARGTTGQATIYLNREWVESSASVESLTRVLIEELGHAVDSSLNGAADTQGDEGELFGQMLMDTSSSDSYASDDDHRQLTIDGQLVDVELANSVFDVNSAKLSFDTSTDIVAGTNVGASKLYSNVITVGGQQIDAIITLTGLQNATLSVFDYEGTSNQPYSTAQGGDAYFQPNVGISTAGGYATFSIKFILGNSYNAGSNPTGTAVTLRNVLANTYDLDGASASTSGRQFTDFSGIGGYTLSTTTQIVTSDQGSGVTRFVTTIGGNIQDLPGTEAGDNIRARVSFDEVSTATIKLGDMGATGTAYYGIDFSQGTTFTNARTVDVSISGAPVQTSETGTSDTFSVALTAAPTADVTVTLSGLDGTEGSLSTTTLTFTTSNWNTPQTVTVTGVDDVDVDGDITYTITATTSSLGDSAYNGRTAVIDVTNLDSEGADSTPPTVAITRDTASLKAGETATLTFTFSEDVGSSFTAGDISVSGGTLGSLTQVDATHYTAVFTPTPGSTANGVVSVASGTFTDVAGNANADGLDANNSVTLAVDTARPTATIVVADTALKLGETSLVTITFSEAVTGFTNADLSIANGTLSSVSSSDGGITWTATFTPNSSVEDTTNLITLTNTGVTDLAGNAGTGSTDSNNYAIDTLRPTATIVVADTALKLGETSLVTITFSEAVTGFTNADLTIANGTLSSVSSADGGLTWTATFTPDAGIEDTTNLITLDNTGVTDAAGNAGTGTTDSNNYAIDTRPPTVAITRDTASLKAGETATLTFTFSEDVGSSFTAGDISVSGGTLGSLTQVDATHYTAVFTPTPGSTANGVVSVASGTFTDVAGNANADGLDANNSVTLAVDTARPTATIVVADTALKLGETSLVTITFSEAVTGFTNADLSIANGTLSSVSSSDGGITWTATFTPNSSVEDTTNLITLTNTGVTDLAGNAGTGSTDSNNYAIDTLRPTATIVVADTALKLGETSLVTITFSEAVTGFTNADLSIANGTLSSVSSADGGRTWTATFTPDAGIEDTTNLITLDNTGVTDAAGNAGTGTTDSNNYAIDTRPPTVAITRDTASLKAGETATLTFTFGEDVGSSFTAGDISVSGGTLGSLTQVDATHYTAVFTPTPGSTANGVVSVASGTFTDVAANANADGLDANNSVTLTVDTALPTVAITPDTASIKAGETATLTFTFSEDVGVSFTAGDISVSGGTLGALTRVDATHYTAVFTPTPGSTANGVVSVASGKFSDVAGNANADGLDVDNSVTLTVNTALPTVAITPDTASLKAGETATLTFTFSEDVGASFTAGDISVSGGTLGALTRVDATHYTAVFTPTPGSTTNGVVSVASGKFTDVAGNLNTDGLDANNSVTLTVDTALPTVAITPDTASLKAGETATLTFTFSEDVGASFTADDISVSGGTLGALTQVDATHYTAVFTPTPGSTTNGVVSVASGKFTDVAGNANTDGADVDNTATLTVDTARPSIVITADKANLQTGETSVLTFALSEAATDFTAADVTVTGGTLSNFSGSGTRYTATFTPSAISGTVSVASGKFSDAAGNANVDGLDADNRVPLAYDPALSISSVTVNENSPYAVFTVSGLAGQLATLSLTGDSGDTAALAALQYYDPSANAGAGGWIDYTPGDVVSLGGSGNLLVRVALSPEQDATADGPETFKLVATNPSQTASTGGLGTLMDDGTGDYFAADNTTATPALPAGIVLDDDRALAVSDVTVNEGSPYAVFTVTGAAGQKVSLGLANQNVDGTDLGALQYFDGIRWQAYLAGELVTLNDAGKLLVRVALSPEQEFVLDGPELFELVATNTGGSVSTGGLGAINDDGTGAYFAEDNNSADSALPSGVVLDNDKPVPPPQKAPQPPVAVAPPAVELPTPEVRVYIPEIPPVTRVSVEPVKELPSLTVTNQIPEQYVDSGARSKFAIPSDAFAHSDPTEVLQLSAMQANGQPLPGWIRFDASSGTFQVDAPAGYAGELRLMIRARDSKGNEVSSIFRFNVGKKREAERQPASRPSLSEQLKQSGRDTRFALDRIDGKIASSVDAKKVARI